MSKQPYPYQTEQNLIDRYLDIPKEQRLPLSEWAQQFQQGIIKTFESVPTLKAMLDYQEWQQQDQWLSDTMHSNDLAADRRRKWRKKPSTVR